jgi:P-type conjugative transfer protein TrbJ
MNKLLATTAIALVTAHMAATAPARAQGWPVFDAQNYIQNLLTAVRELQQIDNQIRSLQNEATMLEDMSRNLQPMSYSAQGSLESTLRQINGLMNRAQGIQYNVNATEAEFARMYPREYETSVTNDQLAQQARQRWLSSMDALQQTMAVQSQVVGNVQADSATLSRLVEESQSAIGALQAQQAGNQLTALAAKQQMQTQELLAAQARAQAMEQARQAQAEEQARAQFERFLGSGPAYGGRP